MPWQELIWFLEATAIVAIAPFDPAPVQRWRDGVGRWGEYNPMVRLRVLSHTIDVIGEANLMIGWIEKPLSRRQ